MFAFNIFSTNKEMLFDTQPVEADIAVLLAGRGVSGEIAREAAQDYLKTKNGLANYFNKIVICGGLPVKQPYIRHLLNLVPGTKTLAEDFNTTQKEADYMKQVLIENGVDEKDIIFVENTSKHTGGNFANIRDFIRRNNIQSANIYATAYHSRRAIETAAVEIPELKCNPVSVWPYGLNAKQWRSRWYKNPLTAYVVLSENRKIKKYRKAGICKAIKLD